MPSNDLEKLLIRNKPARCIRCGGKMEYSGSGKYTCEDCGYVELDDFGKVKEFLDECGPSPLIVIAEATGVEPYIIEMFLKKGRVEIVEGSGAYLQCEKCGCNIRYGKICTDCAKAMTGQLKSLFGEDVGERPTRDKKKTVEGKMHYIKP